MNFHFTQHEPGEISMPQAQVVVTLACRIKKFSVC
jgi:hypothetical protein